MEENREYVLLTALAEIAWADGVLHRREARFFKGVLEEVGLKKEHSADVFASILDPNTKGMLASDIIDEEDKRWIIGFGYLMAAADGEVNSKEMDVIRRFADEFGFDEATVENIIQQAETLMPQIGE